MGKQRAFDVYLNSEKIDTVFYKVGDKEKVKDAKESVRRSLINHDGYDNNIVVK